MDCLWVKIYFLCLFYALPLADISGQVIQDIDGEYIVEVVNNVSAEGLVNSITSKRLSSSNSVYSCNQLMKAPFNLWLFSAKNSHLSDDEIIDWLTSQQGILSSRKNRLITSRVIPDDSDFTKQWQYINDGSSGGTLNADMDMDLAWDITTGGTTFIGDTIVVCVIDDGINAMHEDLLGNIWVNHHETPGNGVDDDKNGYIDDYRGWNVSTNSDNVYSGGTHGTPVTGIIGARGNNNRGVSGVNWQIKLMALNYGFASEANALASYGYAYIQRKMYNESKGAKGAFIVATNASWGVNELSAADAVLWCSLYDSLGSIGILNVGATANTDTDVDLKGDMPTSCGSEYLISVTNLNRADKKEVGSGYGKKSIDLGAYGNQVYTLTRTGYGLFGGTSGAAPHVTGVIGLLYSAPCNIFLKLAKSDPAAAALVAKDMILHGIAPNASMENISTTGGKLNANRALKNIMQLCNTCSPPAGLVIQKNDLSFKIYWHNEQGTSKINLRYRPNGSSTWKEIINVEKGRLIDGLKNCTEYEVQIGSDCGFLPSAYSYSKYITTSGCCDAPTIFALESDPTDLGIKWEYALEATFRLEYKSSGGKWLDTIINDYFFKLNDIPECIAYTFKVSALCSRFGNISEFSPEFNISSYCGSCTGNNYCVFGRKDASQEWIESFTINNIVNKSGTSVGGYRDFTGFNKIRVDADKEFDFVIIPGYAGSPFPDYFKIYIDFDQNGKWTPDELVFKTSTAVTNEVKGKIKVPLKAINGFTKLRVIMSYEQFEGPCNDGKFEYGEVEDYCIQVINKLCVNNTDVRVNSIEKNAVTFFKFKSTQTRDVLRINFRLKGSTDWILATGRDSIRIAGLKECSLYEFRYQLTCDSLFSDFSAIDTFTTSCKSGAIDQLATIIIRPNPANDHLTIDMPDGMSLKEWMIYDISGKVILMKNQTEDLSINISGIKTGVYFIHLITSSGHQSRHKIIII